MSPRLSLGADSNSNFVQSLLFIFQRSNKQAFCLFQWCVPYMPLMQLVAGRMWGGGVGLQYSLHPIIINAGGLLPSRLLLFFWNNVVYALPVLPCLPYHTCPATLTLLHLPCHACLGCCSYNPSQEQSVNHLG